MWVSRSVVDVPLSFFSSSTILVVSAKDTCDSEKVFDPWKKENLLDCKGKLEGQEKFTDSIKKKKKKVRLNAKSWYVSNFFFHQDHREN